MKAEVRVVAYFAGGATRSYQLVQWLDVLARLDEEHPVAIVVRDPDCAAVVRAETDLSVFVSRTLTELTDLYAGLDAKVVVYCNNHPLNFESLLDGRRLHVHLDHGESDKRSMASNNAKAYDRVFVTGEAAFRRFADGLLDFDVRHLVRIGRPQLDVHRPPPLAPSPRHTVLYAPTWEGDAAYNNYTSVDLMGEPIARAVLASPHTRLIYKPHPLVAPSDTPAVSRAHRQIVRLMTEAARRDPTAGHTPVLEGDVLALMPTCDVVVTDVSAVALDWLYGHTDKPIILTDRDKDADRMRREVPIARCADVIDGSDLDALTDLLRRRRDRDVHRPAREAMRRYYFDDLHVGDSTARFLDAVARLVDLRDELLARAGRRLPDGPPLTSG